MASQTYREKELWAELTGLLKAHQKILERENVIRIKLQQIWNNQEKK